MYWLVPFFIFTSLFADLTVEEAIKAPDGQMEVRGFLYETPESSWVLLSQPNVRSCCVTKKDFLTIEGTIDEKDAQRAVSFKGNKVGDHFYVTGKNERKISYTWIGGVLGALGIFSYWWRRKTRE